jgi:hypothetical protein
LPVPHKCSTKTKTDYQTLFSCLLSTFHFLLHIYLVQGQFVARPNVARPNVARPNVAILNVARPNVAYGGMLFFCPWLG